jgi:transcriptional regulator with XRE-family HTH domain
MKPLTQPQPAIGTRVAARRVALGLSRDQVAARAGMTEAYLEYVEDQRGWPSVGVLRRLADALHTTVEQLHGEGALDPAVRLASRPCVDIAPQHKRVVARLSAAECRTLMGSVPVGRVAFVVSGPPLVLPVNFTFSGPEILITTAAMSPLAELARAGRLVSFQVDDIDEPSRLGWSVLCHGPARLVREADDEPGPGLDLVRPWIGDDRHTVVAIHPATMTGRRIGLA